MVATLDANMVNISLIISSPFHILLRVSLNLFCKKSVVTLIPTGVDTTVCNTISKSCGRIGQSSSSRRFKYLEYNKQIRCKMNIYHQISFFFLIYVFIYLDSIVLFVLHANANKADLFSELDDDSKYNCKTLYHVSSVPFLIPIHNAASLKSGGILLKPNLLIIFQTSKHCMFR